MKEELKLYLRGTRQTGLLLMGSPGLSIKSEAMEIAAILLSTSVERLILHPDFMLVEKGENKTMGVEEAMAVYEKSSLLPCLTDKIVIVIDNFEIMNVYGQNKLLKTLEESDNCIIIAIAYSENVLPTIRSRMRIITYSPLTEEECDKIGIDRVSYFICGGCPGLLKKYHDAIPYFQDVYSSIRDIDKKAIFKSLHLVKEKDKQCFFSVYPELTCNMFQFIGKSTMDMGLTNQACINSVNHALLNCDNTGYTSSDFFLDIINIVDEL